MVEEVVVYKLQKRNMGDGEKEYSKEGVLEAHYYFAKNNNNQFLFTTESKLFIKNVEYVLLVLPDGQFGFLSKIVEKGKYPDLPKEASYTVPVQWQGINVKEEQKSSFNWLALRLVTNIISDIPNIPAKPSPQYMYIYIKEFKTSFRNG